MKGKEFYEKEVKSLIKFVGTPLNDNYHHYIYKWVVKSTRKGDLVLDVGCGVGTLCHLLKKSGRNPTGIDLTEESKKIFKENLPGVPFRTMDAHSLDIQDNLFDCVVSNQMLEHLDEPSVVIKEMLRVIKPGGRLVVTVPIGNMLDGNGNLGHVQCFDFYQILHLFEQFGDDFKIYWLNKFKHYNVENGEPEEKNVFGIIMEVK